jgi:hypothetical protein
MAIATGFSKATTEGLILGYDTGDGTNSFRGQPTINKFALPGTAGPGPGSDNNVSFEVQGTGTFVRLGWGQMVGDYLIKPEDVVYKYTLGSNGCHYHGNDLAIPAGTSATFTIEYYVTPDATGFPENSTLLVFENALGGSASVSTEVGVWRTLTFTSGPTGGAGTLRMLVYPGGCGPRMASSGILYMKNPRVEYRAYSTPFVNGERTATRSLLDVKQTYTLDVTNMSFVSPGDMFFDATDDFIDTNFGVNDSLTQVTMEAVVYDTKNNGGYRAIIQNNVASDDALYIQPSNVLGFWPCAASSLTVPANRWAHVVFSYNGSTMRYAVNGVQQVVNSSCADCLDFDFLKIGAHSAGDGERFGGKIAVAKVYNRALTEGEINQNFGLYRTRFNLY